MPTDPWPLAESLRAISNFVVGDATLQATLGRVADLGVQAVSGADFVGITMLLEGRPRTAVFTSPDAPEIDSVQYESGVGPCLDAFRHKQVYRIDDLEQDRHWSPFSERAAERGVRSVMSIPMIARHQGVGAINFYSSTPGAFSQEDVELGIAFATQAALLLVASQSHWDAQLLDDSLAATMASAATVEQAKGILMRTEGSSPDEASELLLAASERDGRTLGEIAGEIVGRTIGEPAVRSEGPT